jgi:YgiT-type zinc finger domain-containing protein
VFDHDRRVTRTFGKGKTAFLIEGVPTVSCPNCGETYLTAATLREVERIRQHRRQLTKPRRVPVATFGVPPEDVASPRLSALQSPRS